MRNINKIAATALALAMTVSFATPVSVNAYVKPASKTSVDYNEDAEGNKTIINKQNGQSINYDAKTKTSTGDLSSIQFVNVPTEKKIVGLKTPETITYRLPQGQYSISNLKVKSGKGNVKVRIAGYNKNTNVEDDKYTSIDPTSGKSYVIDPVTGNRTYSSDDETPRVSYSTYKLHLYGKKVGKSVVTFDIVDANGLKISTAKIKVTVKEDPSAIKSITLGGKNIYVNPYNKATYEKFDNLIAAETTTKKGGKLKVKMNKGYVLKNIYLVKANPYETVQTDDGHKLSHAKTRLDINGDGDCLDTIDGIKEKEQSEFTYEKVKNGSKITLSTVTEDDKDTEKNDTYKKDKVKYAEQTISKYTGNTTSTELYIVYQDKYTKEYHVQKTEITRIIK